MYCLRRVRTASFHSFRLQRVLKRNIPFRGTHGTLGLTIVHPVTVSMRRFELPLRSVFAGTAAAPHASSHLQSSQGSVPEG